MALIRAFETRVAELYRDGEIPGFVHTSLGQEAVAAGVCAALERRRLRHHHPPRPRPLPRQRLDVDGMMAELFARVDGHLPRQGRLDAHRRPGEGHPRRERDRRRQHAARGRRGAVEQALEQGRVAVAFFGEGAVNQGAFHEAVNLAAIWDLPAILVCENNVYAEFSDSRPMTQVPTVAERAAAYGIEAELVDGNDVEAVLRG